MKCLKSIGLMVILVVSLLINQLIPLAAMAAGDDITLSAPYGPPATANNWQKFTIPLTADTFDTDASTFNQLMSSVTQFRIRTEMHNGNDFGALDDVSIGNQYSSNFNSSLEGWSAAGDGTMEWVPTGGTSGGYLQISDWATGDWHWAVAPPNWSGNWSNLIGSSINFYMKTDHPSYSAVIEIKSDDSQWLTLSANPMLVPPGGTSVVTVTPNPVPAQQLSVSLNSSDTGCITVPSSMTIGAGQSSGQFIATAASGADVGCKSVIKASVSGYNDSLITLNIGEVPDSGEPNFGTTDVLTAGFKGNVYFLPENTSTLPDFSTMTPVGTVYTKELNIPARSFDQGFPGITDRFEWFGISYLGGMVVTSPGDYTFSLTSDDGTKLWIDGELVIDNDGVHAPATKSAKRTLSAGQHVVRVDYFQGPRYQIALQLFVESPSGEPEPLQPQANPEDIDDSDGGGSTIDDGGEKQISSFGDAYVYAYDYRNWNRCNWGAYDQLRAGWHPTGGESRAYIKFDLSNIDPSKVNNATLKLYHFSTAGSDNVDIGIYRVMGHWNEGTDTYHSGITETTAPPGDISWVQQPPIDPQPIISFNPGSGLGDWVEVDITPLVKKWLTGTQNDGLVIMSVGNLTQSMPESVYGFASRERNVDLDEPKGTSKAPMLILSSGGSQDTDGDGVPDSSDQCPNTPAGTSVGSNGCPGTEGAASLVVESRTVAPGNQVTVPVKLQNVNDVASLNFNISYDSSVVKVIRVDKGSLLSGISFVANPNESGIIRFGFATENGVDGTGSIGHIVFEAIGSAGSSSPLTISGVESTNSSGNNVSLSTQNGTVSITGSRMTGDYNGDGLITELDALAALRMSVKLLTEDLILDMDQNGKVTAEDARRILSIAVRGS